MDSNDADTTIRQSVLNAALELGFDNHKLAGMILNPIGDYEDSDDDYDGHGTLHAIPKPPSLMSGTSSDGSWSAISLSTSDLLQHQEQGLDAHSSSSHHHLFPHKLSVRRPAVLPRPGSATTTTSGTSSSEACTSSTRWRKQKSDEGGPDLQNEPAGGYHPDARGRNWLGKSKTKKKKAGNKSGAGTIPLDNIESFDISNDKSSSPENFPHPSVLDTLSPSPKLGRIHSSPAKSTASKKARKSDKTGYGTDGGYLSDGTKNFKSFGSLFRIRSSKSSTGPSNVRNLSSLPPVPPIPLPRSVSTPNVHLPIASKFQRSNTTPGPADATSQSPLHLKSASSPLQRVDTPVSQRTLRPFSGLFNPSDIDQFLAKPRPSGSISDHASATSSSATPSLLSHHSRESSQPLSATNSDFIVVHNPPISDNESFGNKGSIPNTPYTLSMSAPLSPSSQAESYYPTPPVTIAIAQATPTASPASPAFANRLADTNAVRSSLRGDASSISSRDKSPVLRLDVARAAEIPRYHTILPSPTSPSKKEGALSAFFKKRSSHSPVSSPEKERRGFKFPAFGPGSHSVPSSPSAGATRFSGINAVTNGTPHISERLHPFAEEEDVDPFKALPPSTPVHNRPMTPVSIPRFSGSARHLEAPSSPTPPSRSLSPNALLDPPPSRAIFGRHDPRLAPPPSPPPMAPLPALPPSYNSNHLSPPRMQRPVSPISPPRSPILRGRESPFPLQSVLPKDVSEHIVTRAAGYRQSRNPIPHFRDVNLSPYKYEEYDGIKQEVVDVVSDHEGAPTSHVAPSEIITFGYRDEDDASSVYTDTTTQSSGADSVCHEPIWNRHMVKSHRLHQQQRPPPQRPPPMQSLPTTPTTFRTEVDPEEVSADRVWTENGISNSLRSARVVLPSASPSPSQRGLAKLNAEQERRLQRLQQLRQRSETGAKNPSNANSSSVIWL